MKWFILMAALVTAGCADPAEMADIEITGSPTGETRADDEYWLIQITGSETQEPPSGMACSVMWSYDIDMSERSITYSDDAQSLNDVDDEPTLVIASSVWDPSSCPIDYRVITSSETTIETEALGAVVVRIADDGTVTVRGSTIAPGQSMTLTGEAEGEDFQGSATFTTELTIASVGAWPHERLNPRTAS